MDFIKNKIKNEIWDEYLPNLDRLSGMADNTDEGVAAPIAEDIAHETLKMMKHDSSYFLVLFEIWHRRAVLRRENRAKKKAESQEKRLNRNLLKQQFKQQNNLIRADRRAVRNLLLMQFRELQRQKKKDKSIQKQKK